MRTLPMTFLSGCIRSILFFTRDSKDDDSADSPRIPPQRRYIRARRVIILHHTVFMSVSGFRTAHPMHSIIVELIGDMHTPTSENVGCAASWKSPLRRWDFQGDEEDAWENYWRRWTAFQSGASTNPYRGQAHRPSSPASPLFLEPASCFFGIVLVRVGEPLLVSLGAQRRFFSLVARRRRLWVSE
ncbi:hypothetical protein Efla_001123 [Eimeria flavescens]